MNLWRSVTGTAGAKVIVMGVAGLLGIVTSRAIIQSYGVDAYAQYGLISGLRNLLPFADLGIGAVVLNVIAESEKPAESGRVRLALMTALRALIASGVVIAAVAVLIGLLGWWRPLLGGGLLAGGGLTATLCLALFGLSLPLGIGVRILIGLRRNTLQALLQGIVSPLFFIGLVGTVLLGLDSSGNSVALISYAAATLTSALILFLAARFIRPQVGRAISDVPKVRSVPGIPVIATAAPVVVQSIATPIAMQSDRLLLSHGGTATQLAEYTFANQIFGMITQAIIAAGVALWPFFARARARGEILRTNRIAGGFLAVSVAMSLVLVVVMPLITRLATGGKIELSMSVMMAFVLLIGVQALNYPPGMYMTDERGLRFQVVPIILMASSNLVVSWLLIPSFGAAGPILGSAITIFVFQVVPNTWWVNRDIRARIRVAADSDNPQSELEPERKSQ